MTEKKGGLLKWLMILGCGGTLLVGVVCGGGGLLLYGGIKKTITGSYAYREAVGIAEPAIEEYIGTPYKPGFWVSGSINMSGGKTESDFMVPLEGPKGSGKLVVKSTCYVGSDCEYHDLSLIVDGKRIDIEEYEEAHQ